MGGTAVLYLDEQEDVVERNQLQAVDPEESNGNFGESSLDKAMELGHAISAAEILEFTIIHVYILEPISLPAEIESALASGTMCYQVLSPVSHDGRQSFLLKNDAGCYFLLLGERTRVEYIGLEEADILPPDNNDDDDGDDGLDFYMLGRQDNVPLDKFE